MFGRLATLALAFMLAAQVAAAQEALLDAGRDGLSRRGFVLLDTSRFVKGSQKIEVPDGAGGGRDVNYAAFYVDDKLVAVDETPPFSITHDFGDYTHKARIVVIGIQYELKQVEAEPEVEAGEREQAQQEAPREESAEPAAYAETELDDAVRITSPTAEEYCYGVKLLSVEVDLPAGRILRVDFFVNGSPAGSVKAPPYEIEHDFGRGFDPQRVRAVAVLTDGRRLASELTTRALEETDYRVRTRLVTLEATVLDWRDRLIGDLAAGEFRVFEDGREQQITHFSIEERPLRVALLIDASGSMIHRGHIERAKYAASQFLDYLRADKDKAALVVFTDQVTVLSRFTDDFRKLKTQISAIQAEGGTAINDALDRVAPMFDDEAGRKAIILVTDGYDEHSNVSVGEAVESVRRSGIKVYSIGIFEHALLVNEALQPPPTHRGKLPETDPEDARKGNRPFKRSDDPRMVLLDGLADETGGAAFLAESSDKLPVYFQRIADELRNQYSIGYVSDNGDYNGKWRGISVKTTRGGLTVRTKKGYYADR